MLKKWSVLLGVLALGACNITNPPNWTADYLFPLDFPAIDLSGVPGGVIPIDTVDFTTPVVKQDVDSGLVGRVLQSQDLAGLQAEVIIENTLDVTGSVALSIAPTQSGLFNTTQSLTTSITVSQGSDTTVVPVSVSVFQGATTLYFQSTVSVAGKNGNISVPAGSQIRVGVNFIGTVRVSK